MQAIVVNIYISRDEFLKLYRGQAQVVRTTSVDGRKVAFPARILQPFLLHTGVRGRFRIWFDAAGKFQRIERD